MAARDDAPAHEEMLGAGVVVLDALRLEHQQRQHFAEAASRFRRISGSPERVDRRQRVRDVGSGCDADAAGVQRVEHEEAGVASEHAEVTGLRHPFGDALGTRLWTRA